MSGFGVNAGEILQRLAGVKVQQGCNQEGSDIGAFLVFAVHSCGAAPDDGSGRALRDRRLE